MPKHRELATDLVKTPLALIEDILVKHTEAIVAGIDQSVKPRPIGPNMSKEVFDEIARFLAKNYPRRMYPNWYAALEQAADMSPISACQESPDAH
jgi:hypothetical protein